MFATALPSGVVCGECKRIRGGMMYANNALNVTATSNIRKVKQRKAHTENRVPDDIRVNYGVRVNFGLILIYINLPVSP